MNVAVVGYGFVGKATEYLLQKTNCSVQIHDPALGHECDFDTVEYAFLCVPTPSTGSDLDLTILKQVYNDYKDKCQLVIRSTIGPDQISEFPDAYIMPEFLREKHWKADVDDIALPLIIGMNGYEGEFSEIFENIGKTVRICSPKEASMFKLMRNTALAMRVALANEFYEICNREDLDYPTLSTMLQTDAWTGGTHWDVPGPDGQLGFGGNCFPKDLTHMANLCYNDFNIMKVALEVNALRRNK